MATLKRAAKKSTTAPAPHSATTAEPPPCGILIEPHKVYTVADAADLMRVCEKTVRRWLKPDDPAARRLRCRRFADGNGTSIYIWGHQLIAFLEPGDAEETEAGMGS